MTSMNNTPDGSPEKSGDVLGRREAPVDRRLDLKALRLAVHGWRLGNPLIYKPGDANLDVYAREFASAGGESGTLIIGDTYGAANETVRHDLLRAILILRPPVSLVTPERIGEIAARVVVTVARETSGRSCAIQGQWHVVMRDDSSTDEVCEVAVKAHEDALFLCLRLSFAPLWAFGQDAGTAPSLMARSDWREVFLARTLRALDSHLESLLIAGMDTG